MGKSSRCTETALLTQNSSWQSIMRNLKVSEEMLSNPRGPWQGIRTATRSALTQTVAVQKREVPSLSTDGCLRVCLFLYPTAVLVLKAFVSKMPQNRQKVQKHSILHLETVLFSQRQLIILPFGTKEFNFSSFCIRKVIANHFCKFLEYFAKC